MTDFTDTHIATVAANEAAREWMDGLVEAQERALREMKRIRVRFIRAIEEDSRPEDIGGWAVNEVQNCQRQPRIDLAPRIAADLAVARHMRKAEIG